MADRAGALAVAVVEAWRATGSHGHLRDWEAAEQTRWPYPGGQNSVC